MVGRWNGEDTLNAKNGRNLLLFTTVSFVCGVIISTGGFVLLTVTTDVASATLTDSTMVVKTSIQTNVITINSDQELTQMAIVNSWPGNGSVENPYRINNLEIDARGGYSAIFVGNTSLYLVISNCTLRNATTNDYLITNYFRTGSGLVLYRVANVVVKDNQCSNNTWSGVLVVESENIRIQNNHCRDNDHGIRLDSSHGVQAIFNDCDGNLGDGMMIMNSDHNLVSNNSFCHATYEGGLDILNSNSNVVKWNTCSNNPIMGIEIQGTGQDNQIINNTCSSNDRGIYLALTNANIVEGNDCLSNHYGVYLETYINPCSGNIVRNNSIRQSSSYGIMLVGECTSNTLYGNLLTDNNHATAQYDHAHIQAYDDGNNIWNSTTTGNQWSDWLSPDSNNDGIVDAPYDIAGGSNNDSYPLTTPNAPAIVPSAPQNLVATSDDGEVHLTWDAPITTGGEELMYHMFRDGVLVWTGYDNHCTDSDLNNGHTYTYKVSANNTAGWGPNSTEVSATPIASNTDDGDNTMLYIGIAVVAILAVAGVAFLMMRRKK